MQKSWGHQHFLAIFGFPSCFYEHFYCQIEVLYTFRRIETATDQLIFASFKMYKKCFNQIQKFYLWKWTRIDNTAAKVFTLTQITVYSRINHCKQSLEQQDTRQAAHRVFSEWVKERRVNVLHGQDRQTECKQEPTVTRSTGQEATVPITGSSFITGSDWPLLNNGNTDRLLSGAVGQHTHTHTRRNEWPFSFSCPHQ